MLTHMMLQVVAPVHLWKITKGQILRSLSRSARLGHPPPRAVRDLRQQRGVALLQAGGQAAEQRVEARVLHDLRVGAVASALAEAAQMA